jgi:hypothetical protein
VRSYTPRRSKSVTIECSFPRTVSLARLWLRRLSASRSAGCLRPRTRRPAPAAGVGTLKSGAPSSRAHQPPGIARLIVRDAQSNGLRGTQPEERECEEDSATRERDGLECAALCLCRQKPRSVLCILRPREGWQSRPRAAAIRGSCEAIPGRCVAFSPIASVLQAIGLTPRGPRR